MTDEVAIKPEALEALERRLLDVHEKRQVRRSMAAWARYKGFEPAPHHLLIMKELEQFITSDEHDVLLLHAPPGCAKSTYISALFPSWYFANFPQNNILFATHSDDFAHRWGRRVRNDIASEAEVLGISLSPSSGAADQFALVEGGEYSSVGAGQGISGFRADLALCDDLFGSREDAWSDTVRQKRWDWYVDDFGPRLKPKAKRILMNDPLASSWMWPAGSSRRIEAGHVRGKVIDIPAIAQEDDPVGRKPGEYLWDEPQGYDYGRYLREPQRDASPMMWSALFQQQPSPMDGDYFKADWFKTYDVAPANETMHIYGASDFAVSADKGDWTSHVVVGVDPDGKAYLLDLWRKQASSDVWVESFCDLVRKWKPMGWAFESGQITSGVGPFLERRMRERRTYVARTNFPTRGDKAVRAQSFRGYIASHGLHVARRAPWYGILRQEMLSFPAGRTDDVIDSLGLFGQLLDTVMRGNPLRPRVPKPLKDRWDKLFGETDEIENWKTA